MKRYYSSALPFRFGRTRNQFPPDKDAILCTPSDSNSIELSSSDQMASRRRTIDLVTNSNPSDWIQVIPHPKDDLVVLGELHVALLNRR